MYKNNFYFFLNTLNKLIIKNIIKFKNICILYRPKKGLGADFKEIEKIRNFCKKNQLPFCIADNYQLALKYNANGIFILYIMQMEYLYQVQTETLLDQFKLKIILK